MFTSIIKEACKNTKNCKCCLNSPPFKLQNVSVQINSASSVSSVNMTHKQPLKIQRVRPFYMT